MITPSTPMATWSEVWKITPLDPILSRKPTAMWAAAIRNAAP